MAFYHKSDINSSLAEEQNNYGSVASKRKPASLCATDPRITPEWPEYSVYIRGNYAVKDGNINNQKSMHLLSSYDAPD